MRTSGDFLAMTPDQRRAVVASILAAGVLRLHTRDALTREPAASPALEKLQNPASPGLDDPDETVLSVHSG